MHGATLRRFISRLKKIGRAHKDDFIGGSALSRSADLGHFISQLKKIGRARKHDFIVIDTPGGVQHLGLIAHGMADTLITPINDSFLDLDVLVAMEQSDLEPQPSVYAKMVWRALEARRKVSGRTTDWIVVRNRLESVETSNQRQMTQVLDVIQRTLGFRIARGLLERPVYREFFAAGLTAFNPIEGFTSAAKSDRPELLARLEVQNLIREIGLIDEVNFEDEAFHEIELEIARAIAEANNVATDKEDLSEEANKRTKSETWISGSLRKCPAVLPGGYYPPTPLICGCAVANLAPSTRGSFIGQSIDLRTLDRHRDAAVTSLIPALSCRSCRPNAPFVDVRLSRTSMADEMREEHRRRECWGQARLTRHNAGPALDQSGMQTAQ